MNLKDKINYYKAALPKVTKAVTKRLIGDKADNETQEFRKAQCESCPLFSGTHCNKNLLASFDDDTVSMETVEMKQAGFIITYDSYNVLRTAIRDGKIYYRGCGCSQTGKDAKWKFSFDEKDLNKKDGTAPCPMGKWSTENFKQWKNESIKKV